MIKCEVCGLECTTAISPKHLKLHGFESAQAYKQAFPGARLRVMSEGTRQKISQKRNGVPNLKLRGRKKTQDQIDRQSASLKKFYKTTPHWNSGKSTPANVKEKISKSNIGIKNIGNERQRQKKHEDIKAVATLDNCEVLSIDDGINVVTAKCSICEFTFSFERQTFSKKKDGSPNNLCPVCHPRQTFRSSGEDAVLEFLKLNYGGKIVSNDRSILGGKEIDILLPDLKLGIEFTGLYWHAENQNAENNHLLWKMQFAARQGITLITVFEDEWLQKQEIVKSRLLGILGNHKTVFARQCNVREISVKERNAFLIENHIQGKDSSKISLGLILDERLVAVASFKKTSMVKGGDGNSWELSRFCSKKNIRVVGGASKLISHFQKTFNLENLNLISYADRRWSTGDLYKKIGFSFAGTSSPSYWYIEDRYTKRVHRSKYMKHKLVKNPEDRLLTEWDLAKKQKLDRIWDCGTTKWVLVK